jgi:hypothetical protein
LKISDIAEALNAAEIFRYQEFDMTQLVNELYDYFPGVAFGDLTVA